MINDGGPAFPSGLFNSATGETHWPALSGMSLRDWFAGQALQGILTRQSVFTTWDEVAAAAYAAADAMLAERQRPGGVSSSE